jgi:hypothetical protein
LNPEGARVVGAETNRSKELSSRMRYKYYWINRIGIVVIEGLVQSENTFQVKWKWSPDLATPISKVIAWRLGWRWSKNTWSVQFAENALVRADNPLLLTFQVIKQVRYGMSEKSVPGFVSRISAASSLWGTLASDRTRERARARHATLSVNSIIQRFQI